MRTILILVLLGLALVQSSDAAEQEEEKQIFRQESPTDLVQVQQLAGTGKKPNQNGKKKTNMRKNKNKNGNGKKDGKRKQNKTRRGKKKDKKKGKRRRNKTRRLKKTGNQKRKKTKTRRGKKKDKKKGKRRRNKRLKKTGNQKRKKTNKPNTRQADATCEKGCSDLLVKMMKAQRKMNTYVKQFNRIKNGQAQATKKLSKKSEFADNATDGPLALLLEAGGGNKSDLNCAGSKTNKAALKMLNLTATLEACGTGLASECNLTKFSEIKAEWTACAASMLEFKTAADDCLKKGGLESCACFNKTATMDLFNKVENCSAPDMKDAAGSDLKLVKVCKAKYGTCRKGGESIRTVLAACRPDGRSEDQLKQDVGVVLKNEQANTKIKEKTTALIAAASGRKMMRARRDVTINGATYALDTCTNWVSAAEAWLAALGTDMITDISAVGTTIAGTDVTCTASDVATLQAVEAKAETLKTKIAKKVTQLQKNLEKATGTTISAADAQSAAEAAATTVAGGAVTQSVKRRKRILADFIKMKTN